jgi:hypothetical protein
MSSRAFKGSKEKPAPRGPATELVIRPLSMPRRYQLMLPMLYAFEHRAHYKRALSLPSRRDDRPHNRTSRNVDQWVVLVPGSKCANWDRTGRAAAYNRCDGAEPRCRPGRSRGTSPTCPSIAGRGRRRGQARRRGVRSGARRPSCWRCDWWPACWHRSAAGTERKGPAPRGSVRGQVGVCAEPPRGWGLRLAVPTPPYTLRHGRSLTTVNCKAPLAHVGKRKAPPARAGLGSVIGAT